VNQISGEINMDSIVTNDNFWEKHNQYEKTARKEAWSILKVRVGISLGISVIVRLAISYFVVPATVLFALFVMESYTSGLAETANSIFLSSATPMTKSDEPGLIRLWNVFSIVIFAMSWVIPWKSPVERQVRKDMDYWWFRYGDKLPMTIPQDTISSESN
jgi:hypothetical protein